MTTIQSMIRNNSYLVDFINNKVYYLFNLSVLDELYVNLSDEIDCDSFEDWLNSKYTAIELLQTIEENEIDYIYQEYDEYKNEKFSEFLSDTDRFEWLP